MIDRIYPIPAFTDNYIWAAISVGSNQACVVDPGDAAPVLEFLHSRQLQLSDVFITHHHPDHTGGLARLIEEFAPRVTGPGSSNIMGINNYVAEGDEVELFERNFQVLEVPGHTLDHIAYYSVQDNGQSPILFCGDTLFAAGCGRLFEGTPEMMNESLAKLAALPTNTNVYCTHEYTLANLRFAQAADPGNRKLQERIRIEQEKRDKNQPTLPSTIQLELETNPFLRCDQPALIKNARAQAQQQISSDVEVFAALRSWKDRF